MGLEGGGFLVVATEAGERLTRGGSLRLDPEGRITDAAGHALLGVDGPIRIPAGAEITIAAEGAVHADGKFVDRLRVETVAAVTQLEHEQVGCSVRRQRRRPWMPRIAAYGRVIWRTPT